MKRFAVYLGFAAALAAACSIQEENDEVQKDDVTFYASFEQPTDGTRVYATDDLFLRWTADDRVSIFNRLTFNQQYRFIGETGDNAGGFNRVKYAEYVTGNPIADIVSVYPYREDTRISEDETITVVLPDVQSYAKNTFGLKANTMVSVSSDDILQYKNVGGYLQLKLYGEETFISSIILRGNRVERIAGKASVTMPLNGVPSVEMSNTATTEVTLKCEYPVALGTTKDNCTVFWMVLPPVTFKDGFTISVYGANGGCYEKSTNQSVTIERNTLTKMSPVKVELDVPSIPIPEMVDLGLSVKWASFNVGATKPEEGGYYYAWGEVKPKDCYDWTTYKWSKGSSTSLTKYCSVASEGYGGFTDNKMILDPEDDAAYMNLGGNWRMPTQSEVSELVSQCSWYWATDYNGVKGYRVWRKGNSIFLPAEGYMSSFSVYSSGENAGFWSSQLYSGTTKAVYLWDASSSSAHKWMYGSRVRGYFVRPVYQTPVEGISLGVNELDLNIGEKKTLSVSLIPQDASCRTLIWSSSDPLVATVSGYYYEASHSHTGTVTAVGTGVTTITVSTEDGGFSASCRVVVDPSLTFTYLEPMEPVYAGEQKNVKFEFGLDDDSAWESATVSYCGQVLQSYGERNSVTFDHQIDAIQAGLKTYTITVHLKSGTTIEKNVYVTVSVRGKQNLYWGIYEELDSYSRLTISSCSARQLATEHVSGVFHLDNIPTYPEMVKFTTSYRGTMWFMYPTEWDSDSMHIIGGGYADYEYDYVRKVDSTTYWDGISYTVRYINSLVLVDNFSFEIYVE